jgi:hypothetical protein
VDVFFIVHLQRGSDVALNVDFDNRYVVGWRVVLCARVSMSAVVGWSVVLCARVSMSVCGRVAGGWWSCAHV